MVWLTHALRKRDLQRATSSDRNAVILSVACYDTDIAVDALAVVLTCLWPEAERSSKPSQTVPASDAVRVGFSTASELLAEVPNDNESAAECCPVSSAAGGVSLRLFLALGRSSRQLFHFRRRIRQAVLLLCAASPESSLDNQQSGASLIFGGIQSLVQQLYQYFPLNQHLTRRKSIVRIRAY